MPAFEQESELPSTPSRFEATGSDSGTYPGGKSGAGIYQRLINLIPRHRVLISAFAGRCGVVRNIRPADHTILIDADESVCQWWHDWQYKPYGRQIEIYCCDSLSWLEHRFDLLRYSSDAEERGTSNVASAATQSGGPSRSDIESFVFCDPPYLLSQRSHGRQYQFELEDEDHMRLLEILTRIPASAAGILLCGYPSTMYSGRLKSWDSIDHRVPTRGGLQDETIWMNYRWPDQLQDYRYVGHCRRSRERIRRRQVNWLRQLRQMSDREAAAMMEFLNERMS